MAFVDVHAHLDDKAFLSDLDDVLFRAKDSNVIAVICNGLNLENNKKILGMAKKYDIIKPAIGLYPTDAIKLSESELQQNIDFIKSKKDRIIGIGEVGIDYHWIKDNIEQKKERDAFAKMIKLSEDLKKPLIVYSRDAEKDAVDMLLSSSNKKILLHCFSGEKSLIKKAADCGWNFSIPANIIFSIHFQELVNIVNVNQLLTETDSPYLGPVKGERNEPANVVESVKMIAKLKKMDPIEAENIIFLNYQKMFL